jgi:hypothetical protein
LRNEELEEQHSLLWSSTSHPSKVKGDSSASTSKGCDRCHHIDIEFYATNLANMEAMKKEIARLNLIITRGCMGEENKKARFTKRKMLDKSKNPCFGYVEGGKTNERKIIKEKECIEFKSTGFLFAQTRRFRAQSPEVPESGSLEPHRQPNSEVPRKFSEVPGSVKTSQRKRTRLSTSMFSRHLTLVCRFRIIQLCLEEI